MQTSRMAKLISVVRHQLDWEAHNHNPVRMILLPIFIVIERYQLACATCHLLPNNQLISVVAVYLSTEYAA